MLPYQNIFFYVTIAVPAVIFLLQIAKRETVKKIVKPAFWVAVALVFGYWSYIVYLQYLAFQAGPLVTTLATVSGLKWFFGYTRLHFWNQHLISFIFALLIFWIAQYFNKKKDEIFFEQEETYTAALGVFLVGYPAFFFYIILVLILSSLFSILFVRRGERLPLYHFWMPTAIFVILMVNFWASQQSWWLSFRF